MQLEKGTPEDALQIAAVYSQAFPESIRIFFGRKAPEALLDFLELSFKMVFYWGGQAVVIKDSRNTINGYCLFSTTPKKRYLTQALFTALRLVGKLSLREGLVLLQNQLLMLYCNRPSRAYRPAQARIVSIAVHPSHQGQGLGTVLLEQVLSKLQGRAVGLNVRTDNDAAKRLYLRCGFEECGRTRSLVGEWLMLHKSP